jgi:hypothetical protein
MVRWSMVGLLCLAPALAYGQPPEALKGPDRAAYQDMKSLKTPVVDPGDEKQTAANRALLTRQAKFIVGQLTDPKRIQMDNLAAVIEEAILTELPIQRGRGIVEMEKYLAFGKEMGEALVKELEPVTKNSKLVVRVNAARLLSVVAELGYDKSAELALAIIAKPDENPAVKHWALRALGNLFAVEPEPVNKDLTVFTLTKNRDLENRCIKTLCDYITTPRGTENMPDDEKAGITYIRREAVKALGMVRTPRLKFQGQVLERPALVLLKVANKDGIVPEPDLRERVEAIDGFCQLFPVVKTNADRQVNCDFAADRLGWAILDIVMIKSNEIDNRMIPWKFEGVRMENALMQWAKNVEDMKLNATVPAAGALHKQFKSDIFDWLKAGNAGAPPNTAGFREWLQKNPPKNQSLFSDEPSATMKAVGSGS